MNWIKYTHKKAEDDYKKGTRVTLDDCIRMCLESIKIHSTRTKNVRINKHFQQMQKIDVMELEALMKIKESS